MANTTTKYKLRTAWQDMQKQQNKIKKYSLDFNNLFRGYGQYKQKATLYDSGWITDSISFGGISTCTKNKLAPASTEITAKIPVDVPEHYLPFVNVSILTRTAPDVINKGVVSYEAETYDSDEYIIKNGADTIYTGGMPTTDLFTQAQVDAGVLNENYAKKAWRADIQYSYLGTTYRVIGNIGYFIVYKDWNEDQNPYSYMTCYHNWAVPVYTYYHKCTDVDSTSIVGTGDLYEVSWVDELQQIVKTENVNFDWDWADINLYNIYFNDATIYRKVGDSWVYHSSGVHTVTSAYTLISMSYTFAGYYMFLDSNTGYFGRITNWYPTTLEGSSRKTYLYCVRTDADCPECNDITFLRNEGDKPEISYTDAVPYAGYNQQVFFTNQDDKYYLSISHKLMFEVPATEITEREIVEYDDLYDGSTLEDGQNLQVVLRNHTFKDRPYYRILDRDIEYKIIVEVTNPLYGDQKLSYTGI